MKECIVCGTFNLKENNYCTHCGCYIVEENICPFCGQKNPDSNNYCINCNKQITPIVIDNFDALFSEYNLDLIVNADISDAEYFDILNAMFKKLEYLSVNGKTAKEKVLQIANTFTPVIPKSSGIVHGEYGNSIIFYDDRLDDSLQIAAIIHELAHYLLFKFTLDLFCKILNVKESFTLEYFVNHILSNSEMEILNEYLAHTVENRYIPIQYQNFSSFNNALDNLNYNLDDASNFMDIAYSYATDFIHFLDKSIDEELRYLIKLQFKKDMPQVNRRGIVVDNANVAINQRNKFFILVVGVIFEELFNNEEARRELEYAKNKFED